MVEIRFYIPGTHTRAPTSDAGSQKSDDEEGEEMSAAQAFHDAVKDKAEIGQVAGDLVLSFEEVLVLTPRGRYDLDMSLEYLRLRGKTYDYKILYSSISKLFLLPKDDQHVLFIVCTLRLCFWSSILMQCAARPQHTYQARPNPVSILGNAICEGGRNDSRAQHVRVR